MSLPPGTTQYFLLAGTWVSWTVVVWTVVSVADGAFPHVRSLVVVGFAGSLLAGLGLLAFVLLVWGYLNSLVGWDGPAYLRALPIVGLVVFGLLALLDGLRRLEPGA